MNRSPIRVLIVDDSPFIRHVLSKYLEAEPGITVVGQAHDGLDALSKIQSLKPDVVTLDIEMPRLDGLSTLRRIMAECPMPVIMLSALTQRGARPTIQALMWGAVDFAPKPASADVRGIIKELGVKIKTAAGTRLAATAPPAAFPDPAPSPTRKQGPRPFRHGDSLIVIGTSTGGPRALQQVLPRLPADLPAAVVIVQHMPPAFTRSLAQRLDVSSAFTVQEAATNDRLAHGLALVVPGDFHLSFKGKKRVALNQGPRRNHIRPAADVSMESAAENHGASVIGVVLTGMGSDGTSGARHIKAAGGAVIAEHESTCVVYGMPRGVVEAGLADRVVPLPEVVPALIELVNG